MPATPRRSTPRRARSSSVASNTSRSSSRAPTSRGKAAAAAAKKEEEERPTLPEERNPILPGNAIPVKLQVINRENKDIVIGRVKLDTVNGANHGFLLKRFDTNAIAASSMFRLAFPYADGEAERIEMAYLDRKFDTDRANGGTIAKPATPKRGRPKKNPTKEDEEDAAVPAQILPDGSTGIRLQGTWLPCENALEIAEEYGLSLYAEPLIEAEAEIVEGVPRLIGAPVATPTATKTAPETPSSGRKRQRTSKAAAEAAAAAEESAGEESVKGTPKATRTRTKRVVKDDGSEETRVTKTTTTIEPAEEGLSQKEIDEEIKKSKALAEEVLASKTKSPSKSPAKSKAGRKRRASNERPTADLDVLADDSSVNFVSRNVRRGTRAVRQRPIATSAGAVGVAAAAGVGALAWLSGGQVDVAQQLIQQGISAFQGFFF
ncbi:unnamed protein product [Sympodiomycopsis kandeliae]